MSPCRALPLLLLLLAAATAPPDTLPVRPDTAQAVFSVRALGFWPFQGRFQRFDGRVQLDAAHPGQCTVSLAIDLTSLHMADPAMQTEVLSADMLDAGTYPELLYAGACDGMAVDGTMTLHGQSHPFHLTLSSRRGYWVAQGSFRRAEWGITGHPLLAGQQVKVRFSVAVSP